MEDVRLAAAELADEMLELQVRCIALREDTQRMRDKHDRPLPRYEAAVEQVLKLAESLASTAHPPGGASGLVATVQPPAPQPSLMERSLLHCSVDRLLQIAGIEEEEEEQTKLEKEDQQAQTAEVESAVSGTRTSSTSTHVEMHDRRVFDLDDDLDDI
ncbi:MAG: hypothetical protein MHM6MM_000093 [Cercozoa sp. M6MM]